MPKNPNRPRNSIAMFEDSDQDLQEEIFTESVSDLSTAEEDIAALRKRLNDQASLRLIEQEEALLKEFLPVIDNMQRAFGAAQTPRQNAVCQGLDMILIQLCQILRTHGVEPVESLGQVFNPYLHEAIGTRWDASKPNATILETVLIGYSRGDKVFRPALVIVNEFDI